MTKTNLFLTAIVYSLLPKSLHSYLRKSLQCQLPVTIGSKKRLYNKYRLLQSENPLLFYHWKIGIKA